MGGARGEGGGAGRGESFRAAGTFAIAPRAFPFSLSAVDNDQPRDARWTALAALLDDPSPTVRQALLAEFAAHPEASAPFLHRLVAGPNRGLARQAGRYLEELKFSDPVAEFRLFIRSLNYELETGTILLARTVAPDFDVGTCCQTLDAIAARCRELIVEPATTREKCRVLNRVLFHEWGFRGNVEHYTDPLNSLLDHVLARRRGIPISLSTLYLLIAHRLELDLEPVGLPGHFVVGCFTDGAPFFIDAFDGGLFRDAGEVFDLLRARQIEPNLSDLAPTPVREVLTRACRNLAHHYAAASDEPHARLFASFVDEFDSTYERHMRA